MKTHRLTRYWQAARLVIVLVLLLGSVAINMRIRARLRPEFGELRNPLLAMTGREASGVVRRLTYTRQKTLIFVFLPQEFKDNLVESWNHCAALYASKQVEVIGIMIDIPAAKQPDLSIVTLPEIPAHF